jgi:iron complex transport system substrate-binding protein
MNMIKKTATLLFASALFFLAQAQAEQRIISVDANSTALLLALGLQEQLVAIDVTSQLPEGMAKLPSIGYHRTLSAEGLLALKPSLVIGSDVMGPANTLHALRSAGVDILQLPSAGSLQGLMDNVTNLAAATDTASAGAALKQQLEQSQQLLQQQAMAGTRIAFLLTMEGSKLRMAGSGTGGDALIQLMGASNAADFINYRNVSAESLLAINPDVILIAGRNPATAMETLLAAQPALKYSQARVVAIDSSTIVAGVSEAAVNEALRLMALLGAAS